MYEYGATLIRVVDGDTIHIVWDMGRDIYINETIRFYGVNAPEMSTPEGKDAKAYVEEWFATNCPDRTFILHTIRDRREKYGRYLGIILSPKNVNLNADLVDSGHAVRYFP